LQHETDGQAETVLAATSNLEGDEQLLIHNSDTWFRSKSLAKNISMTAADGVLGSFRATDPSLSYAKLNRAGKVLELREKEVISDTAMSGLYYFRRTESFVSNCKAMIEAGELVQGEFYITGVINRMLASGCDFELDYADSVGVLGTPRDVNHMRELNKCGQSPLW
jgi:dTDP-glucose pyrophosphorylase